ncbi:hypothetical protein BC939DRAFT_60460 [Gamsiella multidivaricata]|uniref:uncharacterized protein n=1 Tax=Gamsiella multidivaricata TaxID=101098 RepID=UPI00221FB1E3|nr:uncharacterized protein BC939DRAFT_60460 [Gamsiella multidivaricata]KAI7828572.1 hypothetical protein BC939DRAFT_60460 [Gamsiella multidivaricata]
MPMKRFSIHFSAETRRTSNTYSRISLRLSKPIISADFPSFTAAYNEQSYAFQSIASIDLILGDNMSAYDSVVEVGASKRGFAIYMADNALSHHYVDEIGVLFSQMAADSTITKLRIFYTTFHVQGDKTSKNTGGLRPERLCYQQKCVQGRDLRIGDSCEDIRAEDLQDSYWCLSG